VHRLREPRPSAHTDVFIAHTDVFIAHTRERRGFVSEQWQRSVVERPAFGPSPIAMTRFGWRTRHQDPSIEIEKAGVFEIACRIPFVGAQQLVAHPNVPCGEKRRDERSARPVHAGHDQSKGMRHRSRPEPRSVAC
jgi:hypothetical protein